MLKDKKNIGMIILIVIIVTTLIILVSKMMLRQQQVSNNTEKQQEKVNNTVSQKNEEEIQKSNVELSNSEKVVGMNEISKVMQNKTNRCKMIVNGEKVSEREIAYMDFLVNNDTLTGNQDKEDTISKVIKEYAIAQDAKEKNIFLTDEENRNIENLIKEKYKKESEGMNDILDSFHMDYDEFLEFHIDKMKRLELQTKWTLQINNDIKNGKLKTDSKTFNEKCEEFSRSENESQKVGLLFELMNDYKEYLKDKAVVEYMD